MEASTLEVFRSTSQSLFHVLLNCPYIDVGGAEVLITITCKKNSTYPKTIPLQEVEGYATFALVSCFWEPSMIRGMGLGCANKLRKTENKP